MFDYELRQEYELYINQQSINVGYKTLVPSNLEKASNLTVANLYYYFKVRDEPEEELADNILPTSNFVKIPSASNLPNYLL
ncbi:hypothetical protein RIVM261_086710 [Rivularia sp. IAM M-261]|nr:hypothetical protein RIVM261_086710 [Rivularia sp. IAM M-261]